MPDLTDEERVALAIQRVADPMPTSDFADICARAAIAAMGPQLTVEEMKQTAQAALAFDTRVHDLTDLGAKLSLIAKGGEPE